MSLSADIRTKPMSSSYCKNNSTSKFIRAMLTCAMAALAGSCVQVRLLTYPDSFVWLEESAVESAMHDMASSIGRLEQLAEDESNGGANQKNILRELERLESIADSIDTRRHSATSEKDFPTTNHLLLDEHLDEFREQLARARIKAELSPSNYYDVGKIAGACDGCHRLR